MGKLSRKETAAIAFIIAALVCGLGWAGARLRGASMSGVTLQEAFPQPPAGPPPGRPMVPVQPTAGGLDATPADASASTPGSSTSGSAVSASSPPRSGDGGKSAAHLSTSQEGVSAAAPTPEASEIVVHVAGAVHKPGVYHLPVGARNDEAIQKAGGPTSEANMDALNLAARVEDGSQLYLPTRKQHPEGGADAPTESTPVQATSAVTAAHAVAKAGGKSGAHPAAKAGAAKGGKGGKFSSPGQGTVNINTANRETPLY